MILQVGNVPCGKPQSEWKLTLNHHRRKYAVKTCGLILCISSTRNTIPSPFIIASHLMRLHSWEQKWHNPALTLSIPRPSLQGADGWGPTEEITSLSNLTKLAAPHDLQLVLSPVQKKKKKYSSYLDKPGDCATWILWIGRGNILALASLYVYLLLLVKIIKVLSSVWHDRMAPYPPQPRSWNLMLWQSVRTA